MRYDVKDSDGRICPKKATVVEGNLNRVRRKFLRLMMIEMGSTPEEALRSTDTELLENWYAWHVAEHTRGAGDPREPPRSKEFLAKLERCAKMIAIEAILYSEEEVNVLLNTLETEGDAEADLQVHGDQAIQSVPDDDQAGDIQERLTASGRASPDRVHRSDTAPSAPNDDEAGAERSPNPDAYIEPDNMTDAKFEGWVTLSDAPLREAGGNPNMVSTPSQRAAITAAEDVFLARDLAEANRYLAEADQRRKRWLPPRPLRSYSPISPTTSEMAPRMTKHGESVRHNSLKKRQEVIPSHQS
jgi:hypothetical protein